MSPVAPDTFRVVVELSNNRKVARLTDSEFRCLVQGVWPLAAKARPRGYLAVVGKPATTDDIADQAGCSRAVAARTLAKLRDLEMLEKDEGRGLEHVHDWELVNPPPKVDRTAAERQRRRRAKAQKGPDVTPVVTRDSRRDNRDSHAPCHADVTQRDPSPPHPPSLKRANATDKPLFSSDIENVDGRQPAERTIKGAAKATDRHRQLCRLLAELGRRRNPKFKVPKRSETWLNDMRLIESQDGNSPDEIDQLLRWIYTGTSKQAQFWARVVNSPGNLRTNFPRIWADMTADRSGTRSATPVESSASFVERMTGHR